MNIDKIEEAFKSLKGKIVFGIDGYVDEVWEVVESRDNEKDVKKYSQMKKFGELIVNCGTGGLSTEILGKRRCFGGFTANTGKAALNLGISTTMVGLYGKESIDPVFKEFEKSCELYSIGNPNVCYIMEFEDGKIMLVDNKGIKGIDWKTLINVIDEETLKNIFRGGDIIALGYWSNIPTFDEFVDGIIGFLDDNSSQRIFLDLADIRKRDEMSLHKAMDRFSILSKKIPITLSLNEHEADLLLKSYKMEFHYDPVIICRDIQNLMEVLPLDEIIVHTPHFASAVNLKGEAETVPQLYCEKPVRTTAAGDNFNGGYLAASIASLDLYERLAVANAASRVFLGSGHSANRMELIEELKNMKMGGTIC
ncbi:MAG: carbohydrate kinase family protein [Oscillospiraceae bacterium]|nr:carbohydrate kinase family protein [Oscillospiraceae bacterium]